jgi:hypothetical protein
MDIREVIKTVNEMRAAGVIDRYAIGGAVGATFYLEPVATLDVDVFTDFHSGPGSLIVSAKPVIDFLESRGSTMEGGHAIVGGWPVQFLPPGTPLVEEALSEAIEHRVGGESVRVFTAEHLCAIALEVGRAKDKARLLQFIEAGAFDAERFREIVARFGLEARWKDFERQFLGGQQ